MAWKDVELGIRVALSADVPLLQAIERNAVRRYAVIPEMRFCLDLPVRDEVEHRQARAGGLALVCDIAGTAVGFVLAVPKDGRAHLLEIAVRITHQGQGYGRRLIAAVETWAQGSGFTEVTLTTFCNVPWNAPFYHHLGYEVIEVGADRPELAGVLAEEQRAGFHLAPRVAMSKWIATEK